MKQRIYIDTSVFGGCYDVEFDAVGFMRQQRDRLSETLSKMTKSEIIHYFKEVSYKTSLRPSFS